MTKTPEPRDVGQPFDKAVDHRLHCAGRLTQVEPHASIIRISSNSILP
jgi:hypothetical protein